MTFASWYSINRFLPDASIFIYCDRGRIDYRYPLFEWAVKMRAKLSYSRPKNFSGFEIKAETVAVRTWEEYRVVSAKSNDYSTFVSYEDGCGNFVTDRWIDSLAAPFDKVATLRNDSMMLNEKKVFDVWEQVLPIYLQIGNVHA
jgi:hypothetical protein